MEKHHGRQNVDHINSIGGKTDLPLYRSDYMDEEMYVREVIESGSLYSVFQPIVDHQQQLVVAHEALSRPYWNDQILPPDIWFQSSTSENQQIAADVLAIHTALRQFEPGELTHKLLFVNITPTSLIDVNFMNFLENILYLRAVDPTQLVIGIIEYVPYEATVLSPVFQALRSYGMKFALDDIGHECSEKDLVSKVELLEPDYIKIDRSLIHGISTSARQQNALQSILEYIPNLIGVIAEGVERRTDLEWLSSIGVDLSQGYYWSEPLRMAQILSFMKGRHNNSMDPLLYAYRDFWKSE